LLFLHLADLLNFGEVGRHSALGDVADTLALGFLGFIDYLVLVEEFFQI
jgi:hypothetical protein